MPLSGPSSLALHHVSHEPLGSDEIQNINAAKLTSGTLTDARLSVNVLKFTGGYPGGNTTFLRADGTFTPPSGNSSPIAHQQSHQFGGSDELINAAWINRKNLFTKSQQIGPDSVTSYLEIRDQSGEGAMVFMKDMTTIPNKQIGALRYRGGGLSLESLNDDFTIREGWAFSDNKFVLRGQSSYPLSFSFNGLQDIPHSPKFTWMPGGTSDLVLQRWDNIDRTVLLAKGFGDTPLDASQLLSGTVPNARLSVDVLKYTGGYPGGTTNFLRADGTFSAPASGATLPTAALGQILISQGAGIQPVFSINPTASSIGLGANLPLVSSFGVIRLANSTGIRARNAANTNNIDVIGSDANNNTVLGNTNFGTVINGAGLVIAGTGNVYVSSNNVGYLFTPTIFKPNETNGVLDLGDTTHQWKDAYLSGILNTGKVTIASNSPSLNFSELDQIANGKHWQLTPSGTNFVFTPLDDSFIGNPVLTLLRNGNVDVDKGLQVGAGLTVTGTISATIINVATLNVSGKATFNDDPFITKSGPSLRMIDTSAPVNSKLWVMGVDVQPDFYIQSRTDAGVVKANAAIFRNNGAVDIGGALSTIGNILITKDNPKLQVQFSGATTRSSFHAPVANQTSISNNLTYDGTNWNKEDTSKKGTIFNIVNGYFDLYNSPIGANPATLIRTLEVDDVGNTIITGNLNVGASLFTTGGIVAGNGIQTKNNTFVYPGRMDINDGSTQGSWYLGSHNAYGLYSNTGMYLTGGLWVVAGISCNSTISERGRSVAIGDWIDGLALMPGWTGCYKYSLVGKTLNLAATITATIPAAVVNFVLPFNIGVPASTLYCSHVFYQGVNWIAGVGVFGGGTNLTLYPSAGTFSAGNTTIVLNFSIPIA